MRIAVVVGKEKLGLPVVSMFEFLRERGSSQRGLRISIVPALFKTQAV
jgi:hypothetical protein